MTRLELRVGEIVVEGLPLADSGGLGPLVEERLARLAGGGEQLEVSRWVSDQESLADLVASRVWAEVRRAATDLATPDVSGVGS